ncbi:peptidylprolyl isomerase [Alicyclobacillaceae bacterium I2511]|nr:peptidylprolyl isomerase [Alicyclobacillaceae bacterium I2511]
MNGFPQSTRKFTAHRKASLLAVTGALTLFLTACGTPVANNTTAAQNTNTTTSNLTGNTTTQQVPPPPQSQGIHMHWSSPPAMTIDVKKQYEAVFSTNYGNFTVQLFAQNSPHTVNNFVFLANHHFYNNDVFFRIIQNFMIQTGDPLNNGTGGPGYRFADELPPKYPYNPGIVAMANAGPNTNGSQFFICTGPAAKQLPPSYTQFGKVIQGMSVVEKIAAIPVVPNPLMGNEVSKPTQYAIIRNIQIQVHP